MSTDDDLIALALSRGGRLGKSFAQQTAETHSMPALWTCACGWFGLVSEMKANASGCRTCPTCGGSGGLVIVMPDRPSPSQAGDRADKKGMATMRKKTAPRSRCDVPGGFYQSLWIAAWHPSPLNKLVAGHWSKGAKLKAADKEVVQAAVQQSGLLSSEQPRKVSLHLILRHGQRACDPDAHWKSLLDALVYAGMLRGDTPRFCTLGPVWYSRSMSDHWGTIILLEDLP